MQDYQVNKIIYGLLMLSSQSMLEGGKKTTFGQNLIKTFVFLNLAAASDGLSQTTTHLCTEKY